MSGAPPGLVTFAVGDEFQNSLVIRVKLRIGDAAGRYRGRPVAGLEHIMMIGNVAASLPDLVDLQDVVIRMSSRRGRFIFAVSLLVYPVIYSIWKSRGDLARFAVGRKNS